MRSFKSSRLLGIRAGEQFQLFDEEGNRIHAVMAVDTPPLPGNPTYESDEGGPPEAVAIVAAAWSQEHEAWVWVSLDSEAKSAFGVVLMEHCEKNRWYFVEFATHPEYKTLWPAEGEAKPEREDE